MRTLRNLFALSLFLFLLFISCLRANAASTSIIGTVTDPRGGAFNGSVSFTLAVPAQNTSNNTAVGVTQITYDIVNGTVTARETAATPTLLDTDNMQPQGDFYYALFYDPSGTFLWQSNYVIPAGGTWDIGAAVPTAVTTSNISYINPMTTNTNQSVSGTKTFTVPIVSSVITGTAPFTVASQTKVANLRASALTSDTANPASATQPVQLAAADKICWRRASNTSDVCLRISTSSGDVNQFQVDEATGVTPISRGFITLGKIDTLAVSNTLTETLYTPNPDVLTTSQGTALIFFVRMSGNITNTSGAGVNYTFRIRQNSGVGLLLASTATVSIPTASSGVPFEMEVWFTCSIGCGTAVAAWDVSGHYWVNTTSGAITSNGTITMDPTAGITIIGTGQMGTAAATASFTGRVHMIVRVN